MIQILFKEEKFVLEEVESPKSSILSSPLHQIFFQSVLNANLAEDNLAWKIPQDIKPSKTLHRILNHLSKYNLKYELDQQSTRVLKEEEERQQNFQKILLDGTKAKGKLKKSLQRTIEKEIAGSFTRKLTDLQIAGVNHLLKVQNGANFSVPGSGKTSVALATYLILKKKKLIDAMLVIGPSSCFEPWEKEYELCFGKKPKSVRFAGNTKSRRRELCLTAGRYDLLLTTYHSAARDVPELIRMLSKRKYFLVLDESHYVKRPQGGMLVEAVLQLSEYAKRRLILTGTPMPNGLADLWSQFTFLWPEQKPLGTSETFLRKIRSGDESRIKSEVKKTISPLFFRVTKHQLALPEPSFERLTYPMSPLQERIYKGLASKFLLQINESSQDKESLRPWRRARTIRLLQVASNPTLLRKRCDEFEIPPMEIEGLPLAEAIENYSNYETPNKVTAACEKAKQICQMGEKVIIWSTFVHNLKMFSKLLDDLGPAVIHGGVPYATSEEDDFSREKLIKKFQKDPKCQILIANPAACAESISLHKECHHAIYFDRSFNCAHYLQSLDRIHRLGLTKDQKTYYYLFQSAQTIDEVINLRLEEKMKNMEDIIESDLPGEFPGYWTENLGDEELKDFRMVDQHLREIAGSSGSKTR